MVAKMTEVRHILPFLLEVCHHRLVNYKVIGGRKLSGTVTTNVSKNATVALLAASLLNRGTTTIKHVPKIEEVNRLIEVLKSIGAEVE